MASDTASLRVNFLRGLDTVNPHLRKMRGELSTVDNHMRSVSARSVARFALIGGAIASVAGHAVALTSAVGPAIGILGALPAVAFGGAAGLAALLVPFMGIVAAMKSGAGGAANLEAQERRLEMAQRSVADAQLALNRARAEAADRIEDMGRNLRQATLDERSALLAVREAEKARREARRGGDRMDRERADIQYQQAVLSLEEVRDRLKDVTKEEKKRRDEGVEGSDEVKQALRRQQDALYELAQAQKVNAGAVDKAREAYLKLAPAARRLVDVLKGLGSSWRPVRVEMQQTALSGVAGDVDRLSDRLLSVRPHLVSIAGGWNIAFRGVSQYLASDRGLANINESLANQAVAAQSLGRAWAPFMAGFMEWVRIGSDFLPRMGSYIETQAKRFQDWSVAVRESGRGAAWIERAIGVFKDLWAITKNLSAGIKSVFDAGTVEGFLPAMAEASQRFRDWAASTEGQSKLTSFWAALRNLGSQLWPILKALLDILIQSAPTIGVVAGAVGILGKGIRWLADQAWFASTVLPILVGTFIAYKSIMLPITLATKAFTSVMGLLGGIAKGFMVIWRLLNLAFIASPIGFIITLVVALIAIFVVLWFKCEGFRNFWKGMWNVIWGAIKFVWEWIRDNWKTILIFLTGPIGLAVTWIIDHWQAIKRFFTETVPGWFGTAKDWIVNKWNGLIDWIKGLPSRIATAARGLWDGIKDAFKNAINWIIKKWNGLSFTLPSVSAFGYTVGGQTFRVPQIPELAHGGNITREGSAVVGERGPELVTLPRGASVTPLPGGGQAVTVRIDLHGDDELIRWLRKQIRIEGGNVQVVLGTGA